MGTVPIVLIVLGAGAWLALMVLAAMQATSPLAISALRHGFALLLLGSSARLARVARSPAPPRATRARRGTVQRRTERSHP